MTLSFQRLLVIIISLVLITGAAILILFNYKSNIVFFYSPTELKESNLNAGQQVRIGGVVKKNSIKKISNLKNYIEFIVSDNKNYIFVKYEGILPDLFREEQGVVVEGVLTEKSNIKADKIFAKHDENYMPASIKKQLKQNGYWNQNY